jgi:hypothetical protein
MVEILKALTVTKCLGRFNPTVLAPKTCGGYQAESDNMHFDEIFSGGVGKLQKLESRSSEILK